MFFFGLASNIFTLGILGVFSMVFLYQGFHIKMLQANEEKNIKFQESGNILSSIDLVDAENGFVETDKNVIVFNNPFKRIHFFYKVGKILNSLFFTLHLRGPPTI